MGPARDGIPGGTSAKFILRNPSGLHQPVINSAAILIDRTATPLALSVARAACTLFIIDFAKRPATTTVTPQPGAESADTRSPVSTDDAMITVSVCVDKPKGERGREDR